MWQIHVSFLGHFHMHGILFLIQNSEYLNFQQKIYHYRSVWEGQVDLRVSIVLTTIGPRDLVDVWDPFNCSQILSECLDRQWVG